MEQEDQRRAKVRVVDGMRHGQPCREALKLADLPISERTAYRALKVVRTRKRGEESPAPRRSSRDGSDRGARVGAARGFAGRQRPVTLPGS